MTHKKRKKSAKSLPFPFPPLSLAEYLRFLKKQKKLISLLFFACALSVFSSLFLSGSPPLPQKEHFQYMTIQSQFHEAPLSFRDVPPSYPYRNAIAYAARKGVIQGVDNGTAFLPSKPVSRIELIKMLMYSIFSEEERKQCMRPFIRRNYDFVIFPDVLRKSWMADSVCVAQKNGIIKGYSDGYLRPHLRVSFIEAAKIITRAFGIPTPKQSPSEQWYVAPVRELGKRGAIPLSIRTLDGVVTRGEIAEILYRLRNEITNLPSKRYAHFPPIAPPPCRDCLVIDKIGVTVPTVYGVGQEAYNKKQWGRLEKELLVGMRDGVVHYPDTAYPGYIGNVFFTGHSSYYTNDPGKYKQVFAKLAELEVGDEYVIYYRGQKHVYKIFEEKIVWPQDTSVLNPPTDKELSTLMTCWPVWTNYKRKIFVAVRVM